MRICFPIRADVAAMIEVMNIIKEMEMEDNVDQEDEYCKCISSNNSALVDAFVALGGQPDKSGSIRAEVLVEIIKSDFELTIDMEVGDRKTTI